MEFSSNIPISPVFDESKRVNSRPETEKVFLAFILYSPKDKLAKGFQCDVDVALSEGVRFLHSHQSFYTFGDVQSVSPQQKLLFLTDGRIIHYHYLISAKAPTYPTVQEEHAILQTALENFVKTHKYNAPLPKEISAPCGGSSKHNYSLKPHDAVKLDKLPAITFSDKSLQTHITFALHI